MINKFVFLRGGIFSATLIFFTLRLFAQQCQIDPSIDSDQFCDSLEVVNNSVVNTGSIDSVQWHFGEGDTIRVITPPFNAVLTHTYSSQGTFYVAMKVFSSLGCDTTDIDTIQIASPSTSFQVTKGCVNDTTFFTDLSVSNSDSLVSWIWDFGDGNFSYNQNSNHVYTLSNNYDIELKVMNNYGCLDSLIKTELIESPEAGFFADTACFGSATQFTDTSTFITSVITEWEWDFGDGNISTLQNPSYTFTNPGVHNVKLKVTSATGCADSVYHDVLVGAPPIASFLVTLGCPFDTTFFVDESIHNADSIIAWDWDFGDGSPHSFAQDTSHIYMLNGIYNVTLTVVNNLGCSDDTVRTLPMEKPNAGFVADSVCLGYPNTFAESPNLTWYVPGPA